ncbi:MAG: hypothetical protein V8T86_03915 [Victivallis sp.]
MRATIPVGGFHDFRRFEALANRVQYAINKGVFLPNETSFACNECPYRDRCRTWHLKKWGEIMGSMMSEGKFVGRDEIAMVSTPEATASWKPMPHSEVNDAVTDVVKAHDWQTPTSNTVWLATASGCSDSCGSIKRIRRSGAGVSASVICTIRVSQSVWPQGFV